MKRQIDKKLLLIFATLVFPFILMSASDLFSNLMDGKITALIFIIFPLSILVSLILSIQYLISAYKKKKDKHTPLTTRNLTHLGIIFLIFLLATLNIFSTKIFQILITGIGSFIAIGYWGWYINRYEPAEKFMVYIFKILYVSSLVFFAVSIDISFFKNYSWLPDGNEAYQFRTEIITVSFLLMAEITKYLTAQPEKYIKK